MKVILAATTLFIPLVLGNTEDSFRTPTPIPPKNMGHHHRDPRVLIPFLQTFKKDFSNTKIQFSFLNPVTISVPVPHRQLQEELESPQEFQQANNINSSNNNNNNNNNNNMNTNGNTINNGDEEVDPSTLGLFQVLQNDNTGIFNGKDISNINNNNNNNGSSIISIDRSLIDGLKGTYIKEELVGYVQQSDLPSVVPVIQGIADNVCYRYYPQCEII